MPIFDYVAKDAQGRSAKGSVEAADQKSLILALRQKNLSIISVSEGKKKESLFTREWGPTRVPTQELVLFSRQMATMIDAGIPLLQSLEILSEQSDDKRLRKILTDVKQSVSSGASFNQALAKKKGVFTELMINMVKAGEESGSLDEIMDRLATYLEKAEKLKSKIVSAMIYPIVVITLAIGITFLMMVVVIPVFKDMFKEFNAELPVPTQVLVTISDFIVNNLILIVGALAIAFFAFVMFARSPKGSVIVDGIQLKLPVFGILIRKVAVSKFTRTFATLLKSGVPILDSLRIVAKTSGNKVIERAVDQIKDSIKEGQNIAEPLAKSKVFPPMVVRMIAVGETSGELETMLNKIADFYEDQVDTAVAGLTSIIEPLIIAFLGIVIGGIVICMFLPIFTIATVVGK